MTVRILMSIVMMQFASLAQQAYIYTYVDYVNDDARIAIQDTGRTASFDVGFLKSHLPVWTGDEVLFNGQNSIWKCDKEGENLRKLSVGFRASVSNDGTKYACYTGEGITICDTTGKILKIIDIEPWIDISITWMPDDIGITYYDTQKEACMQYFLKVDSIAEFGKKSYQPVWNRLGAVVYNRLGENGEFQVCSRFRGKEEVVSYPGSMAVVPCWSRSGKYIAYLRLMPDSLQPGNTDMFLSELILYDVYSGNTEVLCKDAGFNDKVYPQMMFTADDAYLYYTGIAANGNGVIKRVHLRSRKQDILKQAERIDYRMPVLQYQPEKP